MTTTQYPREEMSPPCPECPDRTVHVHATPYGFLVYAPAGRNRDFVDALRAAAYSQGRDDEAAGLPIPDWASRPPVEER